MEPSADPAQDPDLSLGEPLAKPVPVVVEVQRGGRTWLLRSEGRHIALTLDSLRRLRSLPGVTGLRLRPTLPAPVERSRRFTGTA